ncbi:Bud site selection protein 16 [Meredithblackwellia eburnea MCA 4105]
MPQTNVPQSRRVLSVQSHVVAGYVGNKAATFPLQLLGWEVDQANTVEFSNHTVSYGRWGGTKFPASHLEDIFSALDANGLLRQSHLLTGYVPGAEALLVVSRLVDRLRQLNPNLVYVLDPVMGDDGRIYVSESVVPIYKSLMTKATIATPNYFEAELLTSVKLLSSSSLLLALRTFHELYNIPHVIISAVSLPRTSLVELGLLPSSPTSTSPDEKYLLCAGSSLISPATPTSPMVTKPFGILFPELLEHYEGVGDVFSSLTLGRFDPSLPLEPDEISPLARTAELGIASLQGILRRTRENALSLARGREEAMVPREGEGAEERVRRLRMVELRLVQSIDEIRDPVVHYRAVELPQFNP